MIQSFIFYIWGMKARWYIGILILALTFLGISQKPVLPNQEIVLQFSDGTVSSADAQKTIAIVENQLQLIGAKNIRLQKESKGELRFTYYSNVDAAAIKKMLDEQDGLSLGHASKTAPNNPKKTPTKKQSNPYNLDVRDIQKNNRIDLDPKACLVDIKQQKQQFYEGNGCSLIIEPLSLTLNFPYKKDCCSNGFFLIVKSNTPRKIPEVRAGPLV